MQSGHKRVNSAYNASFSGHKLNQINTGANLPIAGKIGSKDIIQQGRPHTSNVASLSNPGANLVNSSKNARGSLFHSVPLKLEGELSVSKNPTRAGSKNIYPGQRKQIETPNRNNNSINRKTEKRSFTPNSSMGVGNGSTSPITGGSFKINQGLLYPGSKLKKLDVSPKNIQSISKKNKSYNIPKTSRDNLNLTNLSNNNKNKLNETNNSFLNTTDLNKSKMSSGTTGFSKSLGRNATPNMRNSRIKSRDRSPNNDSKLRPNLKSFSKSPNNNLSRLTKKIHVVNSMAKISSSTSPVNSSNSKVKNPFESGTIKQMQDIKNKNSSPQVVSYAKKVNNSKIQNVCNTKFGTPNVRKVVTGNLLNNNTNDVSTNSSIKSKIEMTNHSNNGTYNNINNNHNLNNKKENEREINHVNAGTRYDDLNNITNNTVNVVITNNSINTNAYNQTTNNNILGTRSNLQKENKAGDRENKPEFKDITTSPLLRKKPDVPSQVEFNSGNVDADTLLNNQMINKLAAGKGAFSYNNLQSNNNSNISPPSLQIKKTIKLIHEYSKVGFSGYGVKKVNQDNYFIFKNFVNNPNHIFMAVCDGHGVLGHEVSGYLRENLPITLNNQLKAKNKNILIHNVNSIIEDTFLDINYKLQTSDSIDTTFSGSTCASLIFTPEKILTANVGDSRAVLGRCVNGEWISHDLTRDHKPSEKDEAARIKKKGGRIQPFRDDDNEFIGPARVWLKEDEIPGLAMSRSFGDRVAASVGVIAEPEIMEYKFQEDDKFIIVASDGVWEFIESQECVNIIKEYYMKNDIVGCCEYIYKESSTRWIKEEEVIDDISMIIVFFE